MIIELIMPRTDNAQNFYGKVIIELCAKWKIKHSNSLRIGQR